jgi:phage major head subunit gpT-like protein
MMEDDQYNIMRQIPRMLGVSLRQTEETVATNVLNNGFDSAFTGSDGQPLFSASHPLVGGGTGSNTPSTASDLSQTSLETAIIDIQDFRDDQGLRINVDAKKLVVPRSEYFNARKILQTQYAVGSADNDVNVLSNMDLEIVDTNFLTDQDAWYLTTNVTNGLKFFWRRKPELDRDNDFNTDNFKVKTSCRFSVGFTDWRGAYASPGA